jgi:hypothetical protein
MMPPKLRICYVIREDTTATFFLSEKEKLLIVGPLRKQHTTTQVSFSFISVKFLVRDELLTEELSRKEFFKGKLFEEEFSEVSVNLSISFISQLEHRSAHKLGWFIVQCLSFLLNHVTKKMDI